eukprot:9194257-Pyramimonas_sp.AAC.1
MHANTAVGSFAGAPDGAAKRVRDVPKWVGRTGPFGGALYGATKRVSGEPRMIGAGAGEPSH